MATLDNENGGILNGHSNTTEDRDNDMTLADKNEDKSNQKIYAEEVSVKHVYSSEICESHKEENGNRTKQRDADKQDELNEKIMNHKSNEINGLSIKGNKNKTTITNKDLTKTNDDPSEFSHLDDILEYQLNSINNNIQKHNEIETEKTDDTVATNFKQTENVINSSTVNDDENENSNTSGENEINPKMNNRKDNESINTIDNSDNTDSDSDGSEQDSENDDGIDLMELAMKMIENEPKVVVERAELFSCGECGGGFLGGRRYQLHCLTHIRRKANHVPEFKQKPVPANENYKPTLKCPDCNARFVQPSSLEAHSILHMPFPHVCNCGIGYYKIKDLFGHVKVVHNDNRQGWITDWIKKDIDANKERTTKKKSKKKEIEEKPTAKKRERSTNITYKDDDEIDIKEEVLSDTDSIASNWATKKKRRTTNSNRKNKTKSSITISKFLKMLTPQVGMTESESFMCPLCPKTFLRKRPLQQHLEKHDSNSFPCDHCTKVFVSVADLNVHRASLDLPLQNYKCEFCSKEFTSNKQRCSHILNTHDVPPKKQFQCNVCSKMIASQQGLKIHMRVHTGERPHSCHICNTAFSQQGALKIHMERHTGERNYSCSFCDKKFSTKHSKNLHEMIHMDLKRYVCVFCTKAFNDPSAKARHERTHTGDKKYKCTKCPMSFTDASGLIAHRRRHTGVKDHKCKECGYRFYTKTDLSKHEFLHTKKTAFECDVCGSQFALKQYLKTHIIAMHQNKKVQKCTICKKSLRPLSVALHMKTVHDIVITKGRLKYGRVNEDS